MAAQPLVSQPAFNLSYDIRPQDIGSGYAAGITSAGQSIAGAISRVAGIAEQNQTANDMLTQLSQMKDPQGNPVLSKEDYESIMKKGLGAKHELAGELFGRFHSQYQSMLDQQREIAVAQARQPLELGQTAARTQGAIELERERARLAQSQNIKFDNSKQLAAAQAEVARRKTEANRLVSPSGMLHPMPGT